MPKLTTVAGISNAASAFYNIVTQLAQHVGGVFPVHSVTPFPDGTCTSPVQVLNASLTFEAFGDERLTTLHVQASASGILLTQPLVRLGLFCRYQVGVGPLAAVRLYDGSMGTETASLRTTQLIYDTAVAWGLEQVHGFGYYYQSTWRVT
jgi:hypothetical protein